MPSLLPYVARLQLYVPSLQPHVQKVTLYALTLLDGITAAHVVELRYSAWR